MAPAELPTLIDAVHSKLQRLAVAEPEVEQLAPAVDPRRSVRPEYVVCLEDGKRFKSLKRHLGTHHGTTPDEYRQRWGLPRDYPMVAPNYAERRSEMAKASGLGQKRRKAKKNGQKKMPDGNDR